MGDPEMDMSEEIRILSDLVGFDTVSDRSNLEIVEYIAACLEGMGAKVWRLPSADGMKANLLARIGPEAAGGLLLSAHTDVVPVAGQAWASDPFVLTRRQDRLYGRGAADMKGFVASALVCASQLAATRLRKPVYLAFSYDEELGCLGVHDLIAAMRTMAIVPDLCVVGEPTLMEVGIAHKGTRSFRLTFTGQAAHSSRAPEAVNAVAYAADYVSSINAEAAAFQEHGPFDRGFTIPHTTVHVGVMNGGRQVNIVPDTCSVEMEFRFLPTENAGDLMERLVLEPARRLDAAMSSRGQGCGVKVENIYGYPAFEIAGGHPAVVLAKRCAERNEEVKLSYGTEAGCFMEGLDIPVVVCGPGDIRQAHQPDEFMEIAQLTRSRKFLRDLADACCR